MKKRERIWIRKCNIMSTVLYRFKPSGNDTFIDFLKGIAIILVVLSHTLPHDLVFFPIWGGSKAVPIFLTIQIFHAYKKGCPRILNFKKIFNRVILPFIIFQFLLILFLACAEGDFIKAFCSTVVRGGRGPGSYYIYIYIQFALLLPLFYEWLNKYKTPIILLITVFISILLEIFSSIVDMPDSIYRLLAFRYIFLIYFGFLWVRKGVVFGTKEVFLGIIGFLSVLYFKYFYKPLEPLFFDTAWKIDRWICYFFVMYLFVPLLFVIYKKINQKINKIIKFLGTCSFEIFLMQMLLCIIVPRIINQHIDNSILATLTNILTIQILSISGGVFYYKTKKKLSHYN